MTHAPDVQHEGGDDRIRDAIERLRVFLVEQFCSLNCKLEALMSMSTEVLAKFAKIDAATTAIAARLTALKADRTDDPELIAALDREIAILEPMGADPANPVPVAPPA